MTYDLAVTLVGALMMFGVLIVGACTIAGMSNPDLQTWPRALRSRVWWLMVTVLVLIVVAALRLLGMQQ